MSGPFAIESSDIEALSDKALTELLRRLLILEAVRLGIAKQSVSVSLKLNIPDGGQDGRLEWSGGADPAGWIDCRLNVYQVKATEMGPAKCAEEVQTDGIALKARVHDVVQRTGAYVLFYGRHCEGNMITERVTKIREAMAHHTTQALADAVTIRVFGAEKIAEWTNENASTIAFVLEAVGKPIPATLQPWEGWAAEQRYNLTLHLDPLRGDVLSRVRQLYSHPRSVGRLLGLSGLGKSRLALEAFRAPQSVVSVSDELDPDAEQRALSASCVYISQGAHVNTEVVAVLRSMRARGISGTVVVDECPLDLHKQLERIVTAPDSTLSLLTLDFDPTGDPKSGDCAVFVLDRFADKDVEQLLRGTHVHLPEEQVSRVAHFAQGFPRMADLLVGAIRESEPRLWELESKEVYRRLVVRRSHQEGEVWHVAKALSVLEHLGTEGDVAYQLPIFAEHICRLPQDAVYARLRELEHAGIAYRRGDWLRLTPLPLAIALAAEWWDERWEPATAELFAGNHIPRAMVDAMAAQLRRLKGHPFAERLLNRLYGPDGPFRTRDFLDSAHGSRVTNSLAEVSPKAVCGALFGVFSSLDPDDVRNVRAGRRYLVWALEKLAWWPDTFQEAAWLLLLFGAGENESIGNNARAQFLQLFHVYLSGTEVPAAERLRVIRLAIRKPDFSIRNICVQALLSALTSVHFTRAGSVDSQGAGFRRDDWAPRTYTDIWRYWEEALELLYPFLCAHGELGSGTRSGVANEARGMIRMGAISLIEKSIDVVLGAGIEWPEMLDGLRLAVNYDGENHSSEVRHRLAVQIERLSPANLEGRLQHLVARPSWNELRREADGSITQVAEERARALAAELAADPEQLEAHWHVVVSGEVRQGFAFGRELAHQVADPKRLLNRAVAALRAARPEARNGALVMGMAASIAVSDPSWLRTYVHEIFADDHLRPFAVDMMRAQIPDDEDIALVADAIASRKLDVRVAAHLAFGDALRAVSDDVMGRLTSSCVNAGETGRVVALDLMGMRLHRRQLGDGLLPQAVFLTLQDGVLAAAARSGDMAAHHYAELVKRILEHPEHPDNYRGTLTLLVLEQLSGEQWLSHLLRELLKELLLDDATAIWPLVREKVQSTRDVEAHRLLLALQDIFGNPKVVDAVGDKQLLDWVRTTPEVLHVVARIIRPLRGPALGTDYPSWTAVAQELLREFGGSGDLRSGLWASIQSGTWSGSMVPRLSAQRAAFAELVQHPIEEVRIWARSALEQLDKDIERERKRDEEKQFGIYR